MRKLLCSVLLLIPFINLSASPFDRNANDSINYFRSFDGTRIHYSVKGNGQPVILVHGFITNGDSWPTTPLYDSLLRHNFRIIILDLRGNGTSDHPHDSLAYTGDAEARDVMALARHLQLPAYQVVGYSRGSIITARLLVLDSSVTCAVLGGIGTGFTNPEWPRRLKFYDALSGKDVPELTAMVKNVQAKGLDQRALALMQWGQPFTSPAELSKVEQPVLVIGGDKDEDNDTGGSLAAMMPRGMHGTVAGDHGSVVRSPYFAGWVLDFLLKH
ncbi:alpha/beta fold hydrolase [Chitinophaga qingshengii]|uniref:Alpha/beta hydrolase n=1 Tax=Chitinophaga qingshengii TaxID=1569794 RepID=A0ABR7TH39_9BACT|nr:alpha/beta hydrolase [Chitinophaga qingshengii]MBC9928826.1 alpha/beta hydrolase [Chitinophaga qingshengii]